MVDSFSHFVLFFFFGFSFEFCAGRCLLVSWGAVIGLCNGLASHMWKGRQNKIGRSSDMNGFIWMVTTTD